MPEDGLRTGRNMQHTRKGTFCVKNKLVTTPQLAEGIMVDL